MSSPILGSERLDTHQEALIAAIRGCYRKLEMPDVVFGELPEMVAMALSDLQKSGINREQAKTLLLNSIVWGNNTNIMRSWFLSARDDIGIPFIEQYDLSPIGSLFDSLSEFYCVFLFDTKVYAVWNALSVEVRNRLKIYTFGNNDPDTGL